MSGIEDIRRRLDEAEEFDDCPVTALGQIGAQFHFLCAGGQHMDVPAHRLTANGILALFGGDQRWLVEKFPELAKDGKPNGRFDQRLAAADLMRRCAARGVFNPEQPVRGVGVWRGPHAGLVVHCGRKLWIDREWRYAGREIDGVIYPAAPPVAHPADQPASADEAAEFERAFTLWRYREPLAPELLFGASAVAMLGAAPAWRTHVVITAPFGSGKTALARLIAAAQGPHVPVENNFSEPGLRATLTRQARAVVLDEAENSTEGMANVIPLVRNLSDGANILRSGGLGVSVRASAAGTVFLLAIHPPPLLPQDVSRFFEAELRRLREGKGARASAEQVDTAIARAAELSPGLRARAIAGWSRFLKNFATYRRTLDAAGCSPRHGDKLGTLLAGADMMRLDHAVDDERAAKVVKAYDAVIAAMQSEAEASDAFDCWTHLMTSAVDHWTGGDRLTIGSLLVEAVHGVNYTAARRSLVNYGIRVEEVQGAPGACFVLVANKHRALSAIFRDTDWADGGWVRALRQLPGGRPYPAQRFGAPNIRCTYVDTRHMPPAGGDGPVEQPPPPFPDEDED